MDRIIKTFKAASITSAAALLAAMSMTQGAAASNLLSNPGFEVNSITTAANSLGNFPGFQGVWGQENSTIVGVDAVSPASGAAQLRMDLTGGVTTQAFQTVDVTSFAALIDSGGATLNAGALFNSNAQAAIGGVYISYFTANNYGSLFGPNDLNVMNFDANTATWESASLSVPIPANTRWILLQTAYSEASLFSSNGVVGAGFVDDAYMEIVPAPGSAGLAALAALAMARRRRRA